LLASAGGTPGIVCLSAHEPDRVEGMKEPEIAATALPTVGQT